MTTFTSGRLTAKDFNKALIKAVEEVSNNDFYSNEKIKDTLQTEYNYGCGYYEITFLFTMYNLSFNTTNMLKVEVSTFEDGYVEVAIFEL